MIVMKFGGTSVADAERIAAVAAIVASRRERRPVVVVSAMATVTDRLLEAIGLALAGAPEAVEPLLADVARRHRWAVAGAIETASARHDLTLEIDGLLEELGTLLRSVRILGEGTPRSRDALLAFGEGLASRIVAAAMRSRGLPAVWVDPCEVVVTDASHGRAVPDLDGVARRFRERLRPRLDAGEIPVTGGFVGAAPDGRTTTLGRGGSDTSAAVLGAAGGAEEIQIWTDVDGILTADPRVVPGARLLDRVAFAEAAELAYYGAKILHPAAIAPAVHRGIPVRVLNSLRPEGKGTVVLDDPGPGAPPIASVAGRAGASVVRIASRRMRIDPGFLPRALAALEGAGLVPDLVVSSEVGVAAAVSGSAAAAPIAERVGEDADVSVATERGIVCVVGSGLAGAGGARGRVVAALAEEGAEIVASGGSRTSVSAVFAESRLADVVRSLHRRFFEGGVS